MNRAGAARRPRTPGRLAGRMAGLSYVEVLIATLLITVALVPALEALAPGVTGAVIHANRVEEHYARTSRMEELLAEPYALLDAAAEAAGSPANSTAYSDVVTLADGRQLARNVYLSQYDADNADADGDPFTGTEDDLLWLRVELAGGVLDTLVSAHD